MFALADVNRSNVPLLLKYFQSYRIGCTPKQLLIPEFLWRRADLAPIHCVYALPLEAVC